MDSQTIITVVTTITAALVTITGLVLKDKQDQRRWDRETRASAARHLENSTKLVDNARQLDTIKREVNGKMDRVVSIAHQAGIVVGAAQAQAETEKGATE